jgi:hypothetical protein
MRVDLEYLAKIMDVFLDADTAHINLEDIAKSDINVGQDGIFDEKFIFHIQIALDNQLIAKESGPAYTIKDIGLIKSIDGKGSIVIMPIRLTQTGHDFACSLNNKEVMAKLKSEFKDAPFKVVFDGGQKLLQHFAKKKLDAILG